VLDSGEVGDSERGRPPILNNGGRSSLTIIMISVFLSKFAPHNFGRNIISIIVLCATDYVLVLVVQKVNLNNIL